MILLFCSRMGSAFQNEMHQRIWLLQEFHKGFLLLHQEVSYLKIPLEEATGHAGTGVKKNIMDFFCAVSKRLGELQEASFEMVWEEMVQHYLEDTAMKRTDLELIMQMGQNLGNSVMGEEDRIFRVCEQRLEQVIKEAQEDYKEKAELYKRLGIMGGIFLVILLL